jgi:hypothetical protein
VTTQALGTFLWLYYLVSLTSRFMKKIEYLKELSLVILGVLIALLIENYREDLRDQNIINSYLDIVVEDLNLDIRHLKDQLGQDSMYTGKLKILSDVLTDNRDLPHLDYSLASWTKQDETPYRNLRTWDSLDYYTLYLYNNTEYKTRKIGFSTIVNSNLSHRIERDLLKDITIYYTTESENLDFWSDVDDKCHWNAIPWLNKHQGSFKRVVLNSDFEATLLRNEASGRYNTMLREMGVKAALLGKAEQLLKKIQTD